MKHSPPRDLHDPLRRYRPKAAAAERQRLSMSPGFLSREAPRGKVYWIRGEADEEEGLYAQRATLMQQALRGDAEAAARLEQVQEQLRQLQLAAAARMQVSMDQEEAALKKSRELSERVEAFLQHHADRLPPT